MAIGWIYTTSVFWCIHATLLVGRAVASDTRGPRFESSHRQIYIYIYILSICLLSTGYLKDKNKEKEAGNGPF